MALMLYDPPPLLEKLYTKERVFNFADKDIKIIQDYTSHGVAAVVWDAAIVLSLYLQTFTKDSIDGKSVLELGAGTGLSGIVASLLGFNTTITDRKEVLGQLIDNSELNLNRNIQKYKIKALDWGQDLDRWENENFDYIIGADVVYIEDTFSDLLKTLIFLTDGTKRHTRVLLSCRIRYERDERFINMLRDYFNVEILEQNKEYDVVLYHALRR